RRPAKAGDALEHPDRPRVQVRLVLLGEARERVAGHALERAGAELGDDDRLVIADLEGDAVALLGQAVVPADVLVEADEVRVFAKWIIDDLRVGIVFPRMKLHRGGYEACRIK